MNKNIDNGGPAFPVPPIQHSNGFYSTGEGMSIRDYFAAAALQGLLSSIEPNQLWCGEDVAVTCYRTADTMLKARKE